MKRILVNPRPNWQERLDKIGFYYHSLNGNYWQEQACYVFNLQQIETLELATQNLHHIYLQAAAHIIKTGDYQRLGILDDTARLIEQSWYQKQPCLYGRFDFCYDGIGEPKLLEYNADTPTALFEASVVQWYWLKEQQPHIIPHHADQFNSIHEQLIIAWQQLASQYAPNTPTLYFSAINEHLEDFTTCRYLQDTAIQAKLSTHFIDLRNIGWDIEKQIFVDENNQDITWLFKLYPWEWLIEEEFSKYLANYFNQNHSWLEPSWKLLLSNKAMLAILWELFPNHPNLLPCYFQKNSLAQYVKKPFFSREGANITLVHPDITLSTTGEYDTQNHYVYQQCCLLPKFHDPSQKNPLYPVIGSWVIGHNAAGIGIREDHSPITKDTSLFVPHIFLP